MYSLILSVLLNSLAAQAPASDANPCLLTNSQISSALGVSVVGSKPGMSVPFGAGKMQDCRYTVRLDKREFTLMLKVTRYGANVKPQQHFEMLFGRLKPVPNDPDGARFQEGQGDLTSPVVHYFRNGAGVELRLLGNYASGMKVTDAELQNWQDKLLKLPRVP